MKAPSRYESSKPHFKAWSDTMSRASGGKSVGNLRAMHGKIAAGRLESMHFDDRTKSIELSARVTDDDEWRKIEDGVYTGFSPGGHYLHQWQDGEYTRYTAQPVEISLVDLPCIPSATFTMVKDCGISEERGFHAHQSAELLSKAGARNSAKDLAMIQQMHDNSVNLGAACHEQRPDTDLDPTGGADKAAHPGSLAKIEAELGAIRGELTKIEAERDGLKRRVSELESRPRPGGAVLKSIDKGRDIGNGIATEEDERAKIRAMPNGLEKSLALIKLAHRKPTIVQF